MKSFQILFSLFSYWFAQKEKIAAELIYMYIKIIT